MESRPWIRRLYVLEMSMSFITDIQNGYNLQSEPNSEESLNEILLLEIKISEIHTKRQENLNN